MRTNTIQAGLILASGIIMSGCSQFWPIGPDVTKESAALDAQLSAGNVRLKDILAVITNGDLAQQKNKIDLLEKAPDLDSNPQLQMQLAVLLRLGHPQVRDEKRASQLVRWAVQTGDVPRDRMAAGLIMTLLSEVDSRSIQLEKASTGNRELQNSVRQLEDNVHQLQDKLNAVKSIEQSIIQRGK